MNQGAVEPVRESRWIGHLLVPGLFDGQHQFEIHPLGPDRVRLGEGVFDPRIGRGGGTIAAEIVTEQ
jgi:hypothetical protein